MVGFGLEANRKSVPDIHHQIPAAMLHDASIYKLTIKGDGDSKCYVGSTFKPLSKRLAQHKADFKSWKAGKGRYVTSFDLMVQGEVEISLIERVQCSNRKELRAHEGRYIRTLDVVNKKIAGRTAAEYYEANREEQIARVRAYQAKETEEQKAKRRERERPADRLYQKRRYAAHREELIAKVRAYQAKHHDEYLAKRREKVECPTCGKWIARKGLTIHKRLKHSADVPGSSTEQPAYVEAV